MNSLAYWQERASGLSIETHCFIDNLYQEPRSGELIPCINPANGSVIAQIASADEDDVNHAVAAARSSFELGVWSDASPWHRKKVLLRFAELIEEHNDELALLESLDIGKPITQAREEDIPAAAQCVAWTAEAIDKVYGEIAATEAKHLALITREPLGVIGIIVPWNLPLLLAAWKFAPALASGNSVVIKPPEDASLSLIRLAALAAAAGIPDGVFNVVPGKGEVAGKALGLHSGVDAIAFTGSTEIGKLFMRYSAKSNLKRISLELGGKSPHIVLADCPDVDFAVQEVAKGIFRNQGEICNAGSRLLLDKRIIHEFQEKLIRAAAEFKPGNPLDPATRMGALISSRHRERVLQYIELGSREGLELAYGGNIPSHTDGKGFYIEPTILTGATGTERVAQEEIFGPVLVCMGISDLGEAIRIANDTRYGLAAGLWTADVNKAHIGSRKLRAGLVWVNCYSGGSMATPFGGFKESGFGRDKSLHAFDKYTDLKTTWMQLQSA